MLQLEPGHCPSATLRHPTARRPSGAERHGPWQRHAVSNHPLREGEQETITWITANEAGGVDTGRVPFERRNRGLSSPGMLRLPTYGSTIHTVAGNEHSVCASVTAHLRRNRRTPVAERLTPTQAGVARRAW